jgi:hypothetical protein
LEVSVSDQVIILPDDVWVGKDEAHAYRLRVVDHRRDGRVVCERLGPQFERFGHRTQITVTEYQLLAAYEPSGEQDFGISCASCGSLDTWGYPGNAGCRSCGAHVEVAIGGDAVAWVERAEGDDAFKVLQRVVDDLRDLGYLDKDHGVALSAKPILMRVESDVEAKINGREDENCYIECTARARRPELFWRVERSA